MDNIEHLEKETPILYGANTQCVFLFDFTTELPQCTQDKSRMKTDRFLPPVKKTRIHRAEGTSKFFSSFTTFDLALSFSTSHIEASTPT